MKFSALAKYFEEASAQVLHTSDSTARYRSRAYKRAANVLQAAGDKKATKRAIDALELTTHMKELAYRWINQPPRNTPHSATQATDKKRLLTSLTALMGVGKVRAEQLIADGLQRIDQLKQHKWKQKLPRETQIFIELEPLNPIPRSVIERLEPRIKQIMPAVELVGSYRRGKPSSRDIDVMLVSRRSNALVDFVTRAKQMFGDKVYPYATGRDKVSLVLVDRAQKHAGKYPVVKLDIFRVDPANKVSMLLYSTGSASHNIRMRSVARKLGLLLNQNGLFKKINGQYEKIPGLTTEKAYFTALGMPYRTPKERA